MAIAKNKACSHFILQTILFNKPEVNFFSKKWSKTVEPTVYFVKKTPIFHSITGRFVTISIVTEVFIGKYRAMTCDVCTHAHIGNLMLNKG